MKQILSIFNSKDVIGIDSFPLNTRAGTDRYTVKCHRVLVTVDDGSIQCLFAYFHIYFHIVTLFYASICHET